MSAEVWVKMTALLVLLFSYVFYFHVISASKKWNVQTKIIGAANINLTHLLYVKQNFFFFLTFFVTNFKILSLRHQKIFLFIVPATCCAPFILKVIYGSLMCDCSCCHGLNASMNVI